MSSTYIPFLPYCMEGAKFSGDQRDGLYTDKTLILGRFSLWVAQLNPAL